MDDNALLLEDLPLLQFLPDDLRKLVRNSFVRLDITFGTPIVTEGSEADAFYVLAAGRARVVKRGDRDEEISLAALKPGDTFGEMALVAETARTATVRASSDVTVYKLDRSIFLALLRGHPEIRECVELQARYRSVHNFLRRYSPLGQVPVEALRAILEGLVPVTAAKGDLIIRQGEAAGPMYVVEDGRLRVFVDAERRRRAVAYLRRGDFFGERSVFTGEARAATIEAVTPCRLLRLERDTLDRIVHQHPALRSFIEERVRQYDFKGIARVPLDFAEELLPADVRAAAVGPEQVDRTVEDESPPEATEAAEADAGPFASPEGYFVKRRRRLRRLTFVRQVDEMDCGAAALAMVCRHFGRAVSLSRIRQLVHASLDGTSLRALCRAAEELGLAARSVKASQNTLDEMPVPAIVHWEGDHWIVLYDVGASWVAVADPAIGRRRLPRAEFERRWTGYAALFDYTEAFEQAPVGSPSYAWLWPFLRPFSRLVIRASMLAFVVAALQMVLPVFTQIVVDGVLVDRDVSLLHVLVGSMGAVLVFMLIAMVVQRYLLSFAAVRVDAGSLDYLTRRLLALPMTYFSTRRTGDIQRRLAGLRQVREFVVQYAVGGVTAVVQILVAVVLMFVYSPVLGAAFLATAPLYALLMWGAARWFRPRYHRLEEAFARYHAHQVDAIKGIETVKALGAEGTFRGTMLGEFLRLARRQFTVDLTIMLYDGAVQAVSFVSLVLFLWIGAHQVMAGTLTIGGLVAFNGLVVLANTPIATLLSMWDHLQIASVLLDRLNDVFEPEPEQGIDRSRLRPVRSLEGRIRFDRVGFRFGGPESPAILEDVTFEVAPGTTVAIVGRSGSGKTTLVKCLAGLLEPTGGTIFYDGVDLKTLSYRDLRRQIGFVLQESYLFSGTIAQNIAFSDGEPNMDRVLWAARVANAHEFIDRLPLGYESRVGESGLAISGGQRQRIAIARAVYQQPPVLIFDEATSNLDTESEQAIQENMAELLAGRTSFVIAHRLSTIRDAGVILVLEKGRLVEQGTHDELMKRTGLYYYLVSQQLAL